MVRTLERIEALHCFGLPFFLCSSGAEEVDEDEEATVAAPSSEDESDGGAAPLSGKLVITCAACVRQSRHQAPAVSGLQRSEEIGRAHV